MGATYPNWGSEGKVHGLFDRLSWHHLIMHVQLNLARTARPSWNFPQSPFKFDMYHAHEGPKFAHGSHYTVSYLHLQK